MPRLREFPVVVIPDAYKLTDEFRRALLDYVEAGGSLVLLGEKCARLFEPALGVKFDGPPNQGGVLGSGGANVSWTNGWQKITLSGAKPSPIAVSQPNRRRPENRRPPWLRRQRPRRRRVWTDRFDLRQDTVGYDPGPDWLGHA